MKPTFADLRGENLGARLRQRWLYRGLDAALTASTRPRSRIGTSLRRLLGPGSNFERTAALVELVDRVVPGTAKFVTRSLHRSDRLPFGPGLGAELLAFGSGATVYRLFRAEGPSPGRVLKVYRRSLGLSSAGQRAIAQEFAIRTRQLEDWYHELPELIPACSFFVLHGPLLGKAAAACIQIALPAVEIDLLADHDDEALTRRFQQEPLLRHDFVIFALRSLELWREHGACPDLLGHCNLTVRSTPQGERLCLLEPGILWKERLRERPDSLAAMDRALNRLRRWASAS